jgi:hypothetical protein
VTLEISLQLDRYVRCHEKFVLVVCVFRRL